MIMQTPNTGDVNINIVLQFQQFVSGSLASVEDGNSFGTVAAPSVLKE